MKDKDKITLKTPEAMKLFGRTKKSMDQAKKWGKCPTTSSS